MKRNMRSKQTNERVQKPKITTTAQEQHKDHVDREVSIPDNIENDRRSEEGNGDEHINSGEELEQTVSKPQEGNNSTKGSSGPTPNHSVDKIATTQTNFLCGDSKEDGGEDEQVSQTKGIPTYNWMCLYNETPDEDVNAFEPKDNSLKEGSGEDVNDGEEGKEEDEVEESKDCETMSRKEQENVSTPPLDTGSYNEVQESTSEAIKCVKDDYTLVKTQSKPFQRVWTEEDETTLLEAIGSYKAVHGKDPNGNDLLNIIGGKLSFRPNVNQVKNKIRRLRRIKEKPRMIEAMPAEKSLFCPLEKVVGGQSSKQLKDAEIASIVMTLFQGNETDEVMKLETSISRVAQLIASGLPTKWKDMIKAQVKQFLIGLDNRKAKLELFLKMLEIEAE